jgi:hypothetical protein
MPMIHETTTIVRAHDWRLSKPVQPAGTVEPHYDVCRLAQNLARNCGYYVFPVRLIGDKKFPARSEREGGQGFKDATNDPDEIAWLWTNWPGDLIGIRTGLLSGVSVLDVDQKHPTAVAWWQDSHPLLLPTRTFRTRSGGLHLWFQHRLGVKNSQGRICLGVDTRGEGGFVVYWFGAGFECLDQSPLAPWPTWLLPELTPRLPLRPYRVASGGNGSAALDGILRRLSNAREGERNGVLFWAACRLDERRMRETEIKGLLWPVAISIGLSEVEARRTIASAMGRTVA